MGWWGRTILRVGARANFTRGRACARRSRWVRETGAPLLAALLLVGCAVGSARGPRGAASAGDVNGGLAVAMAGQAAPAEYVVGPEDLLQITLHDVEGEEEPTEEHRVRVSPEGVVTLPLVGAVPVAGQTVRAIEEVLRDRYNTYIHEPHVSVRVEEFRRLRVSVLGYVQRPGFYQLEGHGTLLEALSVAGGLDARAGTTVEITRRTRRGVRTHAVDLERVVRNGDMRLNVPVRAGDVIYVPAAGAGHTAGDRAVVGDEVES